MAESKKYEVASLSESTFADWYSDLELIYQIEGIEEWFPKETEIADSSDTSMKEAKAKEQDAPTDKAKLKSLAKAKKILLDSLKQEDKALVKPHETILAKFKALRTKYLRRQTPFQFNQEFEQLRWTKEMTADQFISKLNLIKIKLTDDQGKFDEPRFIQKLLVSMPKLLNMHRALYQDKIDRLDKVTYDDLCEVTIMAYYRALDRWQESNSNKPPENQSAGGAFMANSSDRQLFWQKGDRANVRCRYCKELGHVKIDCEKLRRKLAREELNQETISTPAVRSEPQTQSDGQAAAVVPGNYQEVDLSDIPEGLHVKATDLQDSEIEIWWADSCAKAHFTGIFENLTEYYKYKESDQVKPFKCVNGLLRPIGYGKCVLEVESESGPKRICLAKVFFVPELKMESIMSMTALADMGCQFTFSLGHAAVTYNSKVLIKGNYDGVNLPTLNVVPIRLTVPFSDEHSLSYMAGPISMELAHSRLDHAPPATIKKMVSGDMVTGLQLNSSSAPTCEDCIMGKMPSLPFNSQLITERVPGRVIHVDTFYSNVPDYKQCKYGMMMVDEASRYKRIFVMQSKDKAYEGFVYMLKKQKAEIGTLPDIIHMDNAKEFKESKKLQALLDKHLIDRDFSVHHCPQQNAVAERNIRTLFNGVRTKLIQTGLPRKLWSLAASATVSVRNKVYSEPIGCTPYELWFGSKPDLSSLRTWGCKVMVGLPNVHLKKLDSRRKPGYFVDYGGDHSNYWVYYRDGGVRLEKHVAFLNELMPGYRDRSEPTKQMIPTVRRVQNFDVRWPKPNHPTKSDSKVLICVAQEEQAEESEPTSATSAAQQPITSTPHRQALQGDDLNVSSVDAEPFDLALAREMAFVPENEFMLDYETLGHDSVTELTDNFGLLGAARQLRERPEQLAVRSGYQIPTSYEEAMKSPIWAQAIADEIQVHLDNETIVDEDLTELNANARLLGTVWVFSETLDPISGDVKYKARLAVQGFRQVYGMDFFNTFSPTISISFWRLLLAVALQRKMHIKQFDVRAAFLNSQLKEVIYVKCPKGFQSFSNKRKRLKKGVYGLKQASSCWFDTFRGVLVDDLFVPSDVEPCVFYKTVEGRLIVIGLYVDDGTLLFDDERDGQHVMDLLSSHFVMKFGDLNTFLGLQIENLSDGSIAFSMQKYIEHLLLKYQMDQANPVTTPLPTGTKWQPATQFNVSRSQENYRSFVGSATHLARFARPDIAEVVSEAASHVGKASDEHVQNLKRLLRYLKGTRHYKIVFKPTNMYGLQVYADADFASTKESKSRSGSFVLFADCLIYWKTTVQDVVARSTCEAEYISLDQGVSDLNKVMNLLFELGVEFDKPVVYNDNSAAVQLTAPDQTKEKSRPILRRFHYVKGLVDRGMITIQQLRSDDQPADILTKVLPAPTIKKHLKTIGILTDEASPAEAGDP